MHLLCIPLLVFFLWEKERGGGGWGPEEDSEMGRETVFLHLQQEEEQEEELGWSQTTRPTRTTLSPSAQAASQRIGPAWRKPQTLLTAATACRPTNFLSLLLFRTER